MKKTDSILTHHKSRTVSENFNNLPLEPIDMQQGTLHFMSIEVASYVYLFSPLKRITNVPNRMDNLKTLRPEIQSATSGLP